MKRSIIIGLGLKVDYTYSRRSRRQAIYDPIITPAFSGHYGNRIAVVIDTSGSMNIKQLGQAIGEVYKILEQFKLPVTIIPCDIEAYNPIKINSLSQIFKIQQLKGGGGTNMVKGIEAALELIPKPDSILVLTDGYTNYPLTLYNIPIIFGILKINEEVNPPRPKSPPWKESAFVDIPINQL